MKKMIKKIRLLYFNLRKKKKILSLNANLSAKYGKGVVISAGTYVSKNSIIGDYSYVNSNSSIENATIGKYCSISSGVYISPYNHKSEYVSTSPHNRYYVEEEKRVKIGNDVLISLNAIILEGISIGDGAIIAAGAIVTKDVKPYEVVGGVPAKHVRYRFDEERINYLLNLKWWDRKYSLIKKNSDFFNNRQEYFNNEESSVKHEE